MCAHDPKHVRKKLDFGDFSLAVQGTDLELILTVGQQTPLSRIAIHDEWKNIEELTLTLEKFVFRLNEMQDGNMEEFYFPLSWGEGEMADGYAWERDMNIKFCRNGQLIFTDKHYCMQTESYNCELEASGFYYISDKHLLQLIQDLKEYNGYYYTEDESYGFPDR